MKAELWCVTALLFVLPLGITVVRQESSPAAAPPPGPVPGEPPPAVEGNADSGALEFFVEVGKTLGGNHYGGTSAGPGRAAEASRYPYDPKRVFVRLWTRRAAGWEFKDEVYTTEQSYLAALTTPTQGPALQVGSTRFAWTPGTNPTAYSLTIGKSPGASEYVRQSMNRDTSFTTSALPFDGSKLYLRLGTDPHDGAKPFSYGNSFRDYVFTAGCGVPAILTTPVGGSTLPGSSAWFSWDSGTGATEYRLTVGTRPGAADLFDKSTGMTTGVTVSALPVDGSPLHARLWTRLGVAWVHRDFPYFALNHQPVAAAPVNLRSVARFAILAGGPIMSTGLTEITGDMGLATGLQISGIPPGILHGMQFTGGPTTALGMLDLTTAYNDASERTVAPVWLSGNLGGLTLPPGLYRSADSLEVSSGDLTLDGRGDPGAVFIFQIPSTLTLGTGRKIFLTGSAQAANIVWQVGTSAVLGAYSVFQGSILASQSVTMLTGATLKGRLATRIGTITLDTNQIQAP